MEAHLLLSSRDDHIIRIHKHNYVILPQILPVQKGHDGPYLPKGSQGQIFRKVIWD
jgi:hypothetical protein